ncbi:M48 family metalloprotease [Blastomonas aquatica]|uniref:LysM domain-containing protein n=1 Tax=Blastomonas aquatica TaxID=1510276 RepID=A0ABQ1JM66_9SPHN|nr:M48 family metalloprotease [Blastomonas aquatica]GGB71809.1 hypothetical protein GCM10010833_28750 [Blastomonas aquatica]
MAVLATIPQAAAQDTGFFLNPIEERVVGRRAHESRLATKLVVYPDAKLAAYVENIGRSCARLSARYPEQFVFTLVDDTNPNASAALGGFLYFHTGMLLWINDEAELAAVMGHEVGHAIKRHGAREMNRAAVANSLIRLMALRRRDPAQFEDMQVKAALALKEYGRDQEFESDAVGTSVLGPLGYDPYGAARMTYQLHLMGLYFDELSGKPNATPLAWRSHPPSLDRVRRTLDLAKAANLGELPRHRDRYLQMIEGIRFDLAPFGGPQRGVLRIYTVRPGDTAASIASRIPVQKPQSFLLAINGLTKPDEVKAGMALKVVLAN